MKIFYISFTDVTGRVHQGLYYAIDYAENIKTLEAKITRRYLIHLDTELIIKMLTEDQINSRWTTKEIINLDI
ncbi:MAG: hypothetical protein ACYCYI_00010 [Saccharofermentanales bacterium]